jgi:peptidoglycan hydrolase CwlO-like protein
MKRLLVVVLFLVAVCSGCSGNNDSSQVQTQQTQISTMKTQLSAIQTQLSSAQTEGSVYKTGINTAIETLTQIQSSLATLAGQTATTNTTPLTTASNQVLVLQSITDSLTASSQTMTSKYNTALASIATLTAQLATANAQVASLTTQLAISQSSSSDLTSQLNAANAQITTLTGQIATLNTAAASLQSQLATATGTIASLNSQVSSLTTQLTTANTTIATRDSSIVTLNSTISTLNATIAAMIATPVQMAVNFTTAVVNAPISVTVTFPDSTQNGKTVTFSSPGGGSLTSTTATIFGTTASTTFSAATPGTYNINALEGLYCGGATVTITPIPATTYSISGMVTLNGTGLQNVIVSLTGTATNAAITDASGNYSFAGVQNGSYTVTPTKAGYSFKPSSISVTVSGANVTGRNFTDIITQTYSCSGTLSPLGRWCDNGDGTIRDMTNGLIWLRNANCTGIDIWDNAMTWSSNLASPACGLSDGSVIHDWRLPTLGELKALNTGTEAVLWGSPNLFSNIQNDREYWSSTSTIATFASLVDMANGSVYSGIKGNLWLHIWPVRSGQ